MVLHDAVGDLDGMEDEFDKLNLELASGLRAPAPIA